MVLPHDRRRRPGRPDVLAVDVGFARPLFASSADADRVANRLAIADHVIEPPLVGADHDGAGRKGSRASSPCRHGPAPHSARARMSRRQPPTWPQTRIFPRIVTIPYRQQPTPAETRRHKHSSRNARFPSAARRQQVNVSQIFRRVWPARTSSCTPRLKSTPGVRAFTRFFLVLPVDRRDRRPRPDRPASRCRRDCRIRPRRSCAGCGA